MNLIQIWQIMCADSREFIFENCQEIISKPVKLEKRMREWFNKKLNQIFINFQILGVSQSTFLKIEKF